MQDKDFEKRTITLNKLTKFGELNTFFQSEKSWEFKIGKGFTGNISDTLKLMDVCKEIAGEEYNKVRSIQTELNIFHLILTK